MALTGSNPAQDKYLLLLKGDGLGLVYDLSIVMMCKGIGDK